MKENTKILIIICVVLAVALLGTLIYASVLENDRIELSRELAQYHEMDKPITSGQVYAIDDMEDSDLHTVRFKQEIIHNNRNSVEVYYGSAVVTEYVADDLWIGDTYPED